MKTNRFWIVIFALVILACAGIMLYMSAAQGSGHTARIYSDGHLIKSIDLVAVGEPVTLTIWTDGGFNTVEAENGRIRVADADCKDGSCMRQGWVSGGITPIVCLPNRLVIEISGDSKDTQDTQVDGVVG